MKIRSFIALFITVLLLTTVNYGWTAAPPQLVSSIPSDGDLTADPWTLCLEFTFNEAMTGAGNWRYSSTFLDGGTHEWSVDMKTFSYCRSNISFPMPLGSYWFKLNPVGHPDFKSAATSIALPETTIHFTVTADGSNDVDIPAPPADEYSYYYIPYFTSGNGFWTGVGIANNSVVDTASVSIMLYNADGSPFSSDPPHAILADGQFVGVLAGGQTATGWVKIVSSEELSGLCFMGSALMADIPFVSELSTKLVIPHVAQDELWDTTIMVCNPNNIPVELNINYTPQDGSGGIAYATQTLPTLGSVVYELGTIFEGSLPLNAGKVKLTALQGNRIAAFALYTNKKTGASNYAGITAVSLD